jgi:hypothetical protein
LSAIVLKNLIPAVSQNGSGLWFEYLAKQQWTYVMRPILISREAYQKHLAASAGHDQTKMSRADIKLSDGLPDWFWMVEFSLPALFTGNRSKLGEVIIRTAVGNAQVNTDLVEAVRIPSLFISKDPTGQFIQNAIELKAHSPSFLHRPHGNEW